MHTDQELLELWANDQKRREFINDYKAWGIWLSQPELNLTFFMYGLPGGGRLIVMEYLREAWASERASGDSGPVVGAKLYIQRGKYFYPSAVSESEAAGRLKDIKETLSKEQKKRDKQCKCGSKCFQQKRDGSVICSSCTAPVI